LAGLPAHLAGSTILCNGLVVGGALIRMLCEESMLAARYPEYAQYAARTWRMVPYVY
jgi:protein-S-isoprenylcysteine O-methyltransferase Ste14